MNCLICDGAVGVVTHAIEGYREGTSFEVSHCPSCDTKFSLPLKSDDGIYESIYSQVERVPGYSRYFRIAEAVSKTDSPLNLLMCQEEAYWGLATQLATLARSDEKIVEVGCGQGYLTYSFIRAGYNATGIDISEVAVGLARSRYGDFYHCCSIEKYVRDVGGAPKYVVMSEVVEHLENPLEVVREAFSSLAPGGSLILTTPNMDAYPGAIWDTDLPPVHLFWFSYESFRHMGAILGARTEFFDFKEYYKRYPKIKYTADAGRGERTSILAGSGSILRDSPSPPIGKNLYSRIPTKIAAPMKRLLARKRGMQLFSADKPGTICVTFRKE